MFKFPTPEQVRFRMAVVLMLCFAVLLWLPTLDFFFGMDYAQQPTENRALARRDAADHGSGLHCSRRHSLPGRKAQRISRRR